MQWQSGCDAGVGSTVPVWIERGVLRLPTNRNSLLILVGPGTGVAPFRAFLEDLQATGVNFALLRHSPDEEGNLYSSW